MVVTHLMSFILFLYVIVLLIFLKILKDAPSNKTYKKPKIELEEIMGF